MNHPHQKPICELLGIDADRYEALFFEGGMQFLDTWLPNDWFGREMLHQTATYWEWWNGQYTRRDKEFLEEAARNPCSRGTLIRAYEVSKNELMGIYPPPMRTRIKSNHH